MSGNTSISCRTRKNQAALRNRNQTSQTTQRKHGLTSGADPAPAAPGLATQHRKGSPAAVVLIAAEADDRLHDGDV
jgi:hypothetical protein